jgi:hypothetical protein
MWNDYFSSDQHKVIDTNSGPFPAIVFPSLCCSASTCDAQLGTDFATTVKKQPYRVAFPNLDRPSRYIGAIVEHERNEYLGIFDRLLHSQKFSAKGITRLCFCL